MPRQLRSSVERGHGTIPTACFSGPDEPAGRYSQFAHPYAHPMPQEPRFSVQSVGSIKESPSQFFIHNAEDLRRETDIGQGQIMPRGVSEFPPRMPAPLHPFGSSASPHTTTEISGNTDKSKHYSPSDSYRGPATRCTCGGRRSNEHIYEVEEAISDQGHPCKSGG